MARYAVFLRGVNVGGVTLKMADVRAALTESGLGDARTLLASGNVVCTYDGAADALKDSVEGTLRTTFGYDAWVVVLREDQLAELLEACPYPADSTDRHAYVTVTSDPAVLDEVMSAVAVAAPDAEQTRLGPLAAAWTAPVGGTLAAPWPKVAGRARFRTALTDRNLRTMAKVRAALADLR